jgi:hypothetical protein
MKCPKCSTELPDGAKYCPYCGPIGGDASGGMHDSVAVHSAGAGSVYAPSTTITVGKDEKRFCPECDVETSKDNKPLKCTKCGKKFCENCEGFYRVQPRTRGVKPFCETCYNRNIERIKQEEANLKGQRQDRGVDILLNENFTYLILENIPTKSFHLFKTKIDKGMKGYCVTRNFPQKIRETYNLKETPILWLSNVASNEAVRPKDLEKLSLSLSEFICKERGILLLEGIEYLITNNNFITVLKLLQSLRDQVAKNHSILLLSINPSLLDNHQIYLLKREIGRVIE